MKLFLLLFLLAFPAFARDYPATVIRVKDGDTVVVNIDLGFRMQITNISVRLSNVNAPEKGGPLGEAAKKWLTDLALGKSVILHTQKNEYDKYGRILAAIDLNGKDLGTAIIAAGHGRGGPGRKDPKETPTKVPTP